MKRSRKIIAAICLMLMIPCFMLPASANSRAQEWYGTDGNGVIFADGDVPIEVTREKLTFDINTLPYATYRDEETFLAYDSKVTAEYTFHNPTDMTVTATLLFPFGTHPEYYRKGNDTDKYGVMVNGEKIEATLRHSNYSEDFNAENDAGQLYDDYITDEIYRPDATVTKYTYEISAKDVSDSFTIRLSNLTEKQIPFTYQGNLGSYRDTNTGDFVFSNHTTKDGETKIVSFYVVGEPLSKLPEAYWKTKDSSAEGRYANFLGTETTTLIDFLKAQRYDDRISDVDWYNSCVTQMKNCEDIYKGQRAIRFLTLFYLLRWYEYEITIEPGESITNTVVAPLYPEIEAWNRPIKYNYTYYLSPAACWANFGELEILINCPYTMLETNLEGFEKTESGYRYVGQGLPTENDEAIDLTFTLEGDDTPLHQPAGDFATAASEGFMGFLQVAFIIILYIGHFIFSFIQSLFN